MKTIDALRDFVSKDGRRFAEIEREFGWSKNTLNRIITRNQFFRDPILSSIQEVLSDKGYVLEELKDLPCCILKIRRIVFLNKKITTDELSKKLGYSDVGKVYSLLRGKTISESKVFLIVKILEELSNPPQKTAKRTIDGSALKEKGKPSIVFDQDSTLTHINYAVFLLLQYGADFLRCSTKEQRLKLRKNLGQSRLFEATSIMSALNSEKANERRKTSNQCID